MDVQLELTPALLSSIAEGVERKLHGLGLLPTEQLWIERDTNNHECVNIKVLLRRPGVDFITLYKIKIALEPQNIYVDFEAKLVEIRLVHFSNLGIKWRLK